MDKLAVLIPNYADLPNLLDTATAAKILGLRPQTLAADRCGKSRFFFTRVGGAVKYPKKSIADYLLANSRGGD